MKNARLPFISLIVSLLIISAAALALLLSFSGNTDRYSDRQLTEVRDTVVAYVAQCYALEGAYPPNLEYLAKNYGLQLDTEHYIYHYDMFASNIMPDVRVFERKAGE